VKDARIAELLDRRRRQTELPGDRLNELAHAEQMLPGGHVLERDGHEDVAHALQSRATQLDVGVLLGDERSLELAAALALEAQERGEVLGVARGLTLEECQLTKLRVEVLGEALLPRVHGREVGGHAQRLSIRLLGDADRLLEQLPEDVGGFLFDIGRLRQRRAELDELDVPA